MNSIYHCMQALTQGWNAVTATRQKWLDHLESYVYPDTKDRTGAIVSSASLLYDAIVVQPAALNPPRSLVIVEGMVFGRGNPLSINVYDGSMQLINESLGQNADKNQEGEIGGRMTMTLEVIAHTRAQCQCVALVALGIMALQTPWLTSKTGPNYERCQFAGYDGPRGLGELTKDGFGMFSAKLRWLFEKNATFPPIFADPQPPAYLSIVDIWSVDQYGNPGHVEPIPQE